jgi:hypothetical protein
MPPAELETEAPRRQIEKVKVSGPRYVLLPLFTGVRGRVILRSLRGFILPSPRARLHEHARLEPSSRPARGDRVGSALLRRTTPPLPRPPPAELFSGVSATGRAATLLGRLRRRAYAVWLSAKFMWWSIGGHAGEKGGGAGPRAGGAPAGNGPAPGIVGSVSGPRTDATPAPDLSAGGCQGAGLRRERPKPPIGSLGAHRVSGPPWGVRFGRGCSVPRPGLETPARRGDAPAGRANGSKDTQIGGCAALPRRAIIAP